MELVSNTTNNRTQNTLLDILDHTITPMGKRLLRMNILQPPCSIDIIRDRLDAIEELSHSEESIFNIQSCLKQLTDLDHTISYLVKIPNQHNTKNYITSVQHAEMKVNQVIALKQTVKCAQDIAECLPQSVKDDYIQNDGENHLLLSTIYKVRHN